MSLFLAQVLALLLGLIYELDPASTVLGTFMGGWIADWIGGM